MSFLRIPKVNVQKTFLKKYYKNDLQKWKRVKIVFSIFCFGINVKLKKKINNKEKKNEISYWLSNN